MVLDINKYCKPSKKRSLLQVLKIKWYKQQKQNIRKHKEIKIEEVKPDETAEMKIVLFGVAMGIGVLIKILEPYKETVLSIGLLILYGIGWLIGIILTIFISKVSVCFLYRTSVSLAAKFVADVWEEVELKRERRKKEINDN
jgi:hypothetical protein